MSFYLVSVLCQRMWGRGINLLSAQGAALFVFPPVPCLQPLHLPRSSMREKCPKGRQRLKCELGSLALKAWCFKISDIPELSPY